MEIICKIQNPKSNLIISSIFIIFFWRATNFYSYIYIYVRGTYYVLLLVVVVVVVVVVSVLYLLGLVVQVAVATGQYLRCHIHCIISYLKTLSQALA